MTRTAVLTTVSGEHELLIAQLGALGLGSRSPDLHVIGALADPAVSRRKLPLTSDRWQTLVVTTRADSRSALPVAASRNAAARAALDAEAELLIFLGVDLIPGPHLVRTMVARAQTHAGPAPVLLFGEARRLPPSDGPVPDVQALERQARLARNAPLMLATATATISADQDPVALGAMAISAAAFEHVGGFPVQPDPQPHAVTASLISAVTEAGGSSLMVGGAACYRHAPALTPSTAS